jgi:hypothetical protein
MKIVVFDGGACDAAFRLLETCVSNLRATYQVETKVFGTSEADAGIEIVDPGVRELDWVVGYVDGYSDRWGDE